MTIRIFFVAFLTITFSGSCKTTYIIAESELTSAPRVTSDTGLNVRVKNGGIIAFSKFVLNVEDSSYSFSGLRPGEYSCYKTLPYIWTNNEHQIWFYSKKGKGLIQMVKPTDYIGEEKILRGNITIVINVNGSFHHPTSVDMTIEY